MDQNPQTQKDKWKKFFIIGYMRAKVNSSRAIKNTVIDGYKEYILDNIENLNDQERMRVFDSLLFAQNYSMTVTKEQFIDSLIYRICFTSQFDFRNGHNILVLSNLLNTMHDQMIVRGKLYSENIIELHSR